MSRTTTGNANVIESTRKWVESVVVDLNLCPFAGKALIANRVRFSVSEAVTEEQLLDELQVELSLLDHDPSIETTLLIHPGVLQEFDHYNQFLDKADRLLEILQLEGVYQVASFHPDYRFAGTNRDDVENFTNRSPYPVLHLIREDSLERALADFADADQIPARNIALMESLGRQKLITLMQACIVGGRPR